MLRKRKAIRRAALAALNSIVSRYVRERAEYIDNNLHHKLVTPEWAAEEREVLRLVEQATIPAVTSSDKRLPETSLTDLPVTAGGQKK